MKFEEALVLMRTGKKLRRACWRTEDSVRLDGAVLHSVNKKGEREMEGYVVPSSWLTADDWEIVEDAPPRMPASDDDGAVEVVARQLHEGTRRGVEGWMDVPEENRAYFRHSAERVLRALREYALQKG